MLLMRLVTPVPPPRTQLRLHVDYVNPVGDALVLVRATALLSRLFLQLQ